MLLARILTIAFCGCFLNANASIGTEDEKNGHVKTMARRLTGPLTPTSIPSTELKPRRNSVSSPSKVSPRKEASVSSESEIIRGLKEKIKLMESQVETSWNKEFQHTEEKVALFKEKKTLLEIVEIQEEMLQRAMADKETLKSQSQIILALEFAMVKLKESHDAKQAEVDALKEKLAKYKEEKN